MAAQRRSSDGARLFLDDRPEASPRRLVKFKRRARSLLIEKARPFDIVEFICARPTHAFGAR